ncbi:NAD(P)H-quinone oxidoreductase [Caulobacter sp. 17J65-9]|uniref:NAD(P)H-quinone oxidoreductase n=1 Tax=Caulobacter sp. 17J65-9 TaxID=2709382 RepID=UPI001F09CF62|nr:NAD(P)H-quinone oxidoreductase [Caulobacter sp. 17J65-9]
MRAEVMRAIEVRGGAGPAEALTLAEVPVPRPKANEILIRVHAAGVNRPDLLQRQGLYPPPPGASDVLGLEVAGEVAMVGEDAVRWRVGDKVTALLGGGGYAEFATVDARHALPIPHELSYVDAAVLPETVFTVWTNVFERGGLKAGQALLVHGATSGIGVTAIQMAKAAGAKVIATSRGAEKAARAKSLGADLSIDSSAGDFVAAVREAGGADVILDMVGGDFVSRNLECLNTDGRLVQIAFQAGATVELDLRRIMLKRLTLTGSTLRSRDPDEKARLAAAVETHVWPWAEAGLLKPPIDAVFPLERAADAHRRLDEGTHVGKVVLTA